MELEVYSSDGSSSNKKEFNSIPTFEGNKGERALKDCIVAYEANLRQGNASSKTRAEVSGTGKKPWRQKGTGMARAGSKRSPIFCGGGVAHGPRPRDYTQKLNKKVRRLGLKRAIFDTATEGNLALIEAFNVSAPKTKLFNEVIIKINNKGKTLIVDEFFKDDVLLAARNIPSVYLIDVNSLNAWDLVRHNKVVMSESAFEKLIQRVNLQS